MAHARSHDVGRALQAAALLCLLSASACAPVTPAGGGDMRPMAAAPPADDDEAPAIGYMSSTMSTGEISYCYDPSSPNEIFVHQDGP